MGKRQKTRKSASATDEVAVRSSKKAAPSTVAVAINDLKDLLSEASNRLEASSTCVREALRQKTTEVQTGVLKLTSKAMKAGKGKQNEQLCSQIASAQVELDDVVLKQLQALRASAEGVAEELRQMEAAMAQAVQSAKDVRDLQAATKNRAHNDGSSSRLLSLPAPLLQDIGHRAGKEARLLCSTLRDGYGCPGSCIIFPADESEVLVEPETSAESSLFRWPSPEGVRVLVLPVDRDIPEEALATISAKFPNVEDFRIYGGCLDFTQLTLPRLRRLHVPLEEGTVLDTLSHLSSIQEFYLYLTDDDHFEVGALARLSALTRLELHELSAGDDEDDMAELVADVPDLWVTLAAIPDLAYLELDVHVDFENGLSEGFEMPALTRLRLRCNDGLLEECDVDFDDEDEEEVVMVYGQRLLQGLPKLEWLQLDACEEVLGAEMEEEDQENVVQALTAANLKHLALNMSKQAAADELLYSIDLSLLPTLTSLHLQLPNWDRSLDQFIPTTLHLQSFHLTFLQPIESHLLAIAELHTIGTCLPDLTHLHVNCTHVMTPVEAPEHLPDAQLSRLTNLRSLGLADQWAVHAFTPVLAQLTSITKLQLDPVMNHPDFVKELTTLTHLRHLTLLRRQATSAVMTVMHLGAVIVLLKCAKKLLRLEVLEVCWPLRKDGYMPEEDVGEAERAFGQLVPPPVSLRQVMVDVPEALGAARKVLGKWVEHVVPPGLDEWLKVVDTRITRPFYPESDVDSEADSEMPA